MADIRTNHTAPHLLLNIHAMPCNNFCRHCWTCGSSKHARIPFETIEALFRRLAVIDKGLIQSVSVLFLDEPTLHPQFVDIFRLQSELGFGGMTQFFPTNGSVLAQMPDSDWDILQQCGIDWFQLIFHGLQHTHDAFTGRKGSFKDLITTVNRIIDRKLSWSAGVIVHKENIDELPATVDMLRSLDKSKTSQVGWFLSSYQGRGRKLIRCTPDDLARLPEGYRFPEGFLPESEICMNIMNDRQLGAQKVEIGACGYLTLDIESDLDIYVGGACDSGGILGIAPHLKSQFRIGSLKTESIESLIFKANETKPEPVRRLESLTLYELAERYGDPECQDVFFTSDLIVNKWGGTFLSDFAP